MISNVLAAPPSLPAPNAAPAAPPAHVAAAKAPNDAAADAAAPADPPAVKPFARLLHAAAAGSTRDGRRLPPLTDGAEKPDHAEGPLTTLPVQADPGEDVPTDGPVPVAATAPDPAAAPTDAAALLASLPPLQPRPLPAAAAGPSTAVPGAPEGLPPGSTRSPLAGNDPVLTPPAPGTDTRTTAGPHGPFADVLHDVAAETRGAEAPKSAAPELPPLPPGPATAPTATAVAASAPAEARIAATPGSADFATQLGVQLSTFVRDGVQHARLELHPVELGPVTVQIQLDGPSAQVNLAAEHASTRTALEQALPQLAGSLREAGLTLTGGGVFEQPRQSDTGGRNDGSAPTREGRPGSERDAARESVTLPAPAAPRRRGVVDLVA